VSRSRRFASALAGVVATTGFQALERVEIVVERLGLVGELLRLPLGVPACICVGIGVEPLRLELLRRLSLDRCLCLLVVLLEQRVRQCARRPLDLCARLLVRLGRQRLHLLSVLVPTAALCCQPARIDHRGCGAIGSFRLGC